MAIYLMAALGIILFIDLNNELHITNDITKNQIVHHQLLTSPLITAKTTKTYKPDQNGQYAIGIFLIAGKTTFWGKVPTTLKYLDHNQFLAFPSTSHKYKFHQFSVVILDPTNRKQINKPSQGILKQALSYAECLKFLEQLKEIIDYKIIDPK